MYTYHWNLEDQNCAKSNYAHFKPQCDNWVLVFVTKCLLGTSQTYLKWTSLSHPLTLTSFQSCFQLPTMFFVHNYDPTVLMAIPGFWGLMMESPSSPPHGFISTRFRCVGFGFYTWGARSFCHSDVQQPEVPILAAPLPLQHVSLAVTCRLVKVGK